MIRMSAAGLCISSTLFALSCKSWDQASESKAIFDQNDQSLPIDQSTINSPQVAWEILTRARDARYASIGMLNEGCTTTWIEGVRGDDAPLLFVTNGHCINSGIPAGTELKNLTNRERPSLDMMMVTLNKFAEDDPQNMLYLRVNRIIYATQTGADVALLEMQPALYKFNPNFDGRNEFFVDTGKPAKLAQMKALGYQPFRLSSQRPSPGDEIENVGIPAAKGNANLDTIALRRSRCKVGRLAGMIDEEVSGWDGDVTHPAVNNIVSIEGFAHRCSVLGGSSGSPMIGRNSEIVGLHFTSTYLPDLLNDRANIVGCVDQPPNSAACLAYEVRKCVGNAPCETVNGKKIVRVEDNYASPISVLLPYLDK